MLVYFIKNISKNILPSLQAATTTGIRTLVTRLTVSQPRATVLGSREKHVNLGDRVTISCELQDNVGAPEFVFW